MDEMYGLLALLVLFVGYWMVSWVLGKVIGYLGDKYGLFKKYLMFQGRPYGRMQTGKDVPDIFVAMFSMGLVVCLIVAGVVWLLDVCLKLAGLDYIGWGVFLAAVICMKCRFLQLERCCLFCSERRADVEAFVVESARKHPYFLDKVTEIVFENGLYMVFPKKPEEVRAAMGKYVKVYTREYTDSRVQLLSNHRLWIWLGPLCVLAIGAYFLARIGFGLTGDWPVFFESVVLGVPCVIYRLKRYEFEKECIDRLREEEGLPEKQYEVLSMEYEGGKVVFRVRERMKQSC